MDVASENLSGPLVAHDQVLGGGNDQERGRGISTVSAVYVATGPHPASRR